MNSDYYVLDGHTPRAVSFEEWQKWRLENWNACHVAKTTLERVTVSTIFLGYHRLPFLFETVVFGDNPLDMEMDRYSTWEEAEAGHEEMVKRVIAASEGEGTHEA